MQGWASYCQDCAMQTEKVINSQMIFGRGRDDRGLSRKMTNDEVGRNITRLCDRVGRVSGAE